MSTTLNLFFSELLKDVTSEKERIMRLLFARGFFIEETQDVVALSALHTPKDISDLASTLKLFKLGQLQEGKINISPSARASQFFVAFEGNRQISKECTPLHYDDLMFFLPEKKSKVETLLMEPFIAAYVTALNFIDIHTLMSCDGNHTKQPISKMSVCFKGRFDRLFHEALMQGIDTFKVLPTLSWKRQNGHEIMLNYTRANKEHTYLALQSYATFIYKNQPLISKAKQSVVQYFESADKESITDEMFIEITRQHIIKNLLLR